MDVEQIRTIENPSKLAKSSKDFGLSKVVALCEMKKKLNQKRVFKDKQILT